MEVSPKELSERDLVELLVRWRNGQINTGDLQSAVDNYLQQSAEASASPTSGVRASAYSASLHQLGLDGSDVRSSSEAAPLNRPDFASSRAIENATNESDLKSFGKLEFPKEELEPYQPLADVLDEPRGAWIPDFWGMYYAVDDFLYSKTFGLVTVLNATIASCLVIVISVAIGAWQINKSIERQKKATYKSMTSTEVKSTREPITPKLAMPELVNPELVAPVRADVPPENPLSDAVQGPAAEGTGDSEPTANAELAEPLQRMEAKQWTEALAQLQALEDSGRAGLQPQIAFMKAEIMLQMNNTESLELARQALMDTKFEGHEITFHLLMTRWMLKSSPEARQRFIRESASLPEASRERMIPWAKVRSGAADALTETELQSNVLDAPCPACDLLFLASFHFNATKRDQSTLELLDAQQKLRGLNAATPDAAVSWIVRSSKDELVAKIDEILRLMQRKQIN